MRGRRLLLLVGVAASLAWTGCGGGDGDDPVPPLDGEEVEAEAAPWPGESDETQPYELGDGLVADLPEGWEVTPFTDPDYDADCTRRFATLSDGETSIDLELNGSDCAGADQDQIGNGNHGAYVTIDDVPDPRSIAEHIVSAGTLTTFVQDYFECTNSCTDYTDNVGVLTLTGPPSPEFPTVVVLDEKGERSTDELVALADAIHPA